MGVHTFKIVWGLSDSEDAAREEWVRLPDNSEETEAIEVPDEVAPEAPAAPAAKQPAGNEQRKARDILLEAAVAIGHADKVEPIIQTVVEENWLESADDLRTLSEANRKEYRIPQTFSRLAAS